MGNYPLDSASDAVAPLYGGAAKAIAFELYEIDSAVLDDPTNRFELVDSVTGEVLVSDVAYSYWQGIDSVYGTQTLSFLYPPAMGPGKTKRNRRLGGKPDKPLSHPGISTKHKAFLFRDVPFPLLRERDVCVFSGYPRNFNKKV